MIIKKFKKFIKEAISGTYDISPLGPGFPRQELKVGDYQNTVIWIEELGEFFTEDKYDYLYNEYIKKGGKPLFGFNKENLEKVIFFEK